MSTYLITQATGHQSQWTIDYLLAAGAKVHALVRDPAKTPSWMERPGITIFPRENDSPESIFKAAQGTKGVFLNTFPNAADVNAEAEQVKVVLEASKKAGVEIVVASTSFFTGDRNVWGDEASHKFVGHYYESKAKIEDSVRGAGFKSYTILRPALIHHDYLLPRVSYNFPDLARSARLGQAFDDGIGMLHIDEKDIGNFAAAALLDPVLFGGQEIELINENLTMEEVAKTITRISGRTVTAKKWDEKESEQWASLLLTKFAYLFNAKSLSSSAKEVEQKFGIKFTSLEEYFQREKAALLECVPAEP